MGMAGDADRQGHVIPATVATDRRSAPGQSLAIGVAPMKCGLRGRAPCAPLNRIDARPRA